MPHEQEPALCSAIILSDNIIREHGTHKLSLLGCFVNYVLDSFPARLRGFFATALLTNLRGNMREIDLAARVTDKAGGVYASCSVKVGFKPDMQFESTDVVEVPFSFPSWQVPAPGLYFLEVLADGDIIGKRSIKVFTKTATVAGE